jgi:hypothetical protein
MGPHCASRCDRGGRVASCQENDHHREPAILPHWCRIGVETGQYLQLGKLCRFLHQITRTMKEAANWGGRTLELKRPQLGGRQPGYTGFPPAVGGQPFGWGPQPNAMLNLIVPYANWATQFGLGVPCVNTQCQIANKLGRCQNQIRPLRVETGPNQKTYSKAGD